MASVFTFDPNPPKLSSPWPRKPVSDSMHTSGEVTVVVTGGETLPVSHLADCGVTRLEAEPQDGPTEYKLHLLLRPRRSFTALSTVDHVSGSHHSKSGVLQVDVKAELRQARSSPGPAPNSQSRQNRLEHLTTQLLWRLQQSSPYHSSSKSDLVVPVLPHADVSLHLQGPEKLLSGLEESQGALYEIGVSDDGDFVGLTEDELNESLTTLRAMASSLGCKVEVLRMVLVGTAQWAETFRQADGIGAAGEVNTENLWVAEALVTPNHDPHIHFTTVGSLESDRAPRSESGLISQSAEIEQVESQTEQLRVSLTGSTTSGKSSLLGTLSTSTLDNGRGKSRLSLLKHRHEIVSGISSSVTPELIGYHDTGIGRIGIKSNADVINYASGNVSSWTDIHSASEPGRLVFFTDSAGHPRYCRTIVRGLVSWAPHWTICCVAADGEDRSDNRSGATSSSHETLSPQGCIDSSEGHLILSLKLNLPLVVVITKLDLASKSGLRQTLTKILSILKSSGRQPAILSATSTHHQDHQFQALTKEDEDVVLQTISSVSGRDINLLVPILLTSAVTGAGIGKLHALLRHLPIPRTVEISSPPDNLFEISRPTVLFHIDEVFNMSDGQSQPGMTRNKGTQGLILSGHLRYGPLIIGDELLVGPFTSDAAVDDSVRRDIHRAKSFSGQINGSLRKLAISYDGHRPSSADFTAAADDTTDGSAATAPCWQKLCVTSLRNLRLPVRKLLAGQVGTVGITFSSLELTKADTPHCRIRKGMVLMKQPNDSDHHQPPLCRVFAALFDEFNARSMIHGMPVTVYIASIRASAKILMVQAEPTSPHGVFLFDESNGDNDDFLESNSSWAHTKKVSFQFVNSREWMELGTQVLVMPAGGHGIGRTDGGDNANIGLDGFVGKITETWE